jgi:hypothetical protein
MDISEIAVAPTAEVVLSVERAMPCAWCLSEQGIPAGEGSHGICKMHVDRIFIQWREKREVCQSS